jgi:hypothetical protein
VWRTAFPVVASYEARLGEAVIGSGFPFSGFGPKPSVYPTMYQIFVSSPDYWYIVSMCLSLLVNSTVYCVDHYLSISTS